MAWGYLVAKTMYFVSKYSKKFHFSGPKLFVVFQNEKFKCIVLSNSRITKIMSPMFLEWLGDF